jgi:hypothetical protein
MIDEWSVGRFIPEDFFILMTAFMDRGSVAYKNPAYFFSSKKKYLGVVQREKA